MGELDYIGLIIFKMMIQGNIWVKKPNLTKRISLTKYNLKIICLFKRKVKCFRKKQRAFSLH